MKKSAKSIVALLITFIIGISTTVGAATIFNSKDITYSSDKTEVTNVKDSLDELYNKSENIGKCLEGNLCREAVIKNVQLGDYISMTPTSTNYTISKDLTGYTTDQTINPSELNLWRVISKNSDGTVDVVSEYVSSKKVKFDGKDGYMKFIGTLNIVASQYTNAKYVSSTRYLGYTDQKETCTGTLSTTTCPSDTGYEKDVESIRRILGSLESKTPSETKSGYWIASRLVFAKLYYVRGVGGATNMSYDVCSQWLYGSGAIYNMGVPDENIRPVLTLKADISIVSGDGKSAKTAYQLG